MRIKTVFLLFFWLMLSGCSSEKFEFVDGGQVSVSSYQGQWVLVNYWAIWCKPCIKEIPELNKVDRRRDVSVLAYNFDQNRGEMLASQMDELGMAFPALSVDPASMFSQEMVGGLPASMLIAPDGRFKVWLIGEQTYDSIAAVIDQTGV